MECYSCLRNIQDLLSDGKSPYERRFGIPFNGSVIPFGPMVEYHLVSSKDQSRLHQFGAKVLPRKFLGYVLYPGKSGIMIADIEELEKMDASDLHARMLNAKEVLTPQRMEISYFLWQMGQSKPLEEINVWEHLSKGSSRTRRGTRSSSRRIRRTLFSNPLQADSTRDDAEAKNDFWSMSGNFKNRHHVEPRVKLYSPREESFPITLKYIDVTRNTHHWKYCWTIFFDDYWNVDGERELSDAWTGFTRFILLNERPPNGYTWSGWNVRENKQTSRPDDVWPDMWKRMSDASKRKAKQKWAIEKPKLENGRHQWVKEISDATSNALQNTSKLPRWNLPQHSGKTRPNMLVLSMPTNLWEYDWKEYRTGIMKITPLQWTTSLFWRLKH